MANIIFNKNFNKRYLFRYVENMFLYPTKKGGSHITLTDNTGTAFNTSTDVNTCSTSFITNESTLNTLDKISTHYQTTDFTTVGMNDIGSIISTIVSYIADDGVKSGEVLAQLVTDGVITQVESDAVMIVRFEDNLDTDVTMSDDGVMTISIPNVTKLESRYDNTVMNPLGETLYICFPAYTSERFMGTSEDDYLSPVVSTDTMIQSVSYVAASLGTLGTEDIIMDYIEKIDYLDDFSITVQLPKSFS
jgi:hypothetical protein